MCTHWLEGNQLFSICRIVQKVWCWRCSPPSRAVTLRKACSLWTGTAWTCWWNTSTKASRGRRRIAARSFCSGMKRWCLHFWHKEYSFWNPHDIDVACSRCKINCSLNRNLNKRSVASSHLLNVVNNGNDWGFNMALNDDPRFSSHVFRLWQPEELAASSGY